MLALLTILILGHSMEPLLHDNTRYVEVPNSYQYIHKGSFVDWQNPVLGRLTHVVKTGRPGKWVTGPLNPRSGCGNCPYDPGYVTPSNFYGIILN